MRKNRSTAPEAVISPERHRAVIFDLDGVVTRTAKIHARAWKQMFDDWLKGHAAETRESFEPFDIRHDYAAYVDGKPRYDGVQSFLESRDIRLPWGSPDDPPGKETVCGLGNRKNAIYLETLDRQKPEVFESTVALIRELKNRQIKVGLISASNNARRVLESAGLLDLFDTRVDGITARERNLKGKPEPDVFLEAVRELGTDPDHAVVVEDAISGVQAGSRGGFDLVIGVDRDHNAKALQENGADVVIRDLAEVSLKADTTPDALRDFETVRRRLENRTPALFLDYDGTLSPIVPRPEDAHIPPETKLAVKKAAGVFQVAVVSGRDLPDVRQRVGIEGIYYAGSHGFEIAGPDGFHYENDEGRQFLDVLETAENTLKEALADEEGVQVERKKYAIAIHYRRIKDPEKIGSVENIVENACKKTGRLRKSSGKKVFELHPDMDWNKGKALAFLMETLRLDPETAMPVYIGDDTTDEDAFRMLKETGAGIGIRVLGEEDRETAADYILADTQGVREFLERLSASGGGQ